MGITQLISLILSTSVILTVFAFGLDARVGDVTWLLRKPGLLVRSIFSMNVLMVILAIAAAEFFHLDPAIKTAIVALAISPIPPLFPKKGGQIGITGSYAIALVMSAALLSMVLIPGWVELLSVIFHFQAHVGVEKILQIVLTKILLPLCVGILAHRFAPDFSERLVKPISLIATLLLVVGVLPVLFVSYHAMWAMVGNGVLIAVAVFSLVGIVIGHLLGGPDPQDRSILALATSTRHPGIAIAISVLNFPERKEVLIVVLFHLVVGAIVAIPYIKWRKRGPSVLG
jgi:bile acid:Na+ symporter, BASS family